MKRGFDSYFGFFVGDDDDTEEEEESLKQINAKKTKHRRNKNKRHKRKPPKKHRYSSNHRKPKLVNLIKQELKYKTGLYASKAVSIIKQSKSSQPYFIYLSLFTKTYPRELRKLGHKGNLQKAKTEDHKDKILELDKAFSSIVEALKSTGQYENTVIVFMSDNGGEICCQFDHDC